MSDPTKKIELTVQTATVEDLEYIAQKSGLAPGEIVDRLVARASTDAPDIAERLAMDSLIVAVSKLSGEDLVMAIFDIATNLMLASPAKDIDTFVANIRSLQEKDAEMNSLIAQNRAIPTRELEELMAQLAKLKEKEKGTN
jgi:hypothetical protein